jgi:hypothetical protein
MEFGKLCSHLAVSLCSNLFAADENPKCRVSHHANYDVPVDID